MLEVRLENTWQHSFCYALVTDEPKNPHYPKNLLLTIISGNDSTIQATKAAIDSGTNGLAFGYGEKDTTDYRFHRDDNLLSEKGKYTKFPISIDPNRKAVAIVHNSLLGDDEYVLSFDGDPAEDIRQILGGGNYGLHILPEWKDILYQTLLEKGFIEKLDFYCDKGVFPNGFEVYRLKFTEEEADDIVSDLIKRNILTFPKSGTGTKVKEIQDLSSYLVEHMDDAVEKLSEEIEPEQNPLTDDIFPYFNEYKRPLFPVQGHVATAIAKRLKKQKSMLLQGEMSCETFNSEKLMH